MTYRRAFQVGDRIQIGEITGDVVEIRLQLIHMRTIKNEDVIVPNSMILNSHITNYSSMAREKGLILHTAVTIGYDAPWRQVHELLLTAAGRTNGLLKEPPPLVLQRSLDDFYVRYELNVYTDTPQNMAQLYSELHKNFKIASTNTACRSCLRITVAIPRISKSFQRISGTFPLRESRNNRGMGDLIDEK